MQLKTIQTERAPSKKLTQGALCAAVRLCAPAPQVL